MIRKALPRDAHAIAQVHISSWQAAYADLMPADYLNALTATLARRESRWASSIESGESVVFVAQSNNQVVGWIAVGASRDDDAVGTHIGEVSALYVSPGAWQTGVGLALWKAGLEHLREQGHRRATLWVLAGNERAIRFYRRAGCSEEPGSGRNLQRGGVTLTEVRYALLLTDAR